MKIECWAQPGLAVPYGVLSVLRTDPGGLVAFSWTVPDDQAEAAQVWIKPRMLPSPEPPPPPPPPPGPDPILAEIDGLVLPVAVKTVLRKLAAR